MQDTLIDHLVQALHQDQLRIVFQPVVDTRSFTVLGYEALLCGPSHSPLRLSDVYFNTAEQGSLLKQVELFYLDQAMKQFRRFCLEERLFLNLHAITLGGDGIEVQAFHDLAAMHRIKRTSIVIEVSERQQTLDMNEAMDCLHGLKSAGFRLAIDDIGTGYSGLLLWSELKPEFVRIDKQSVREVYRDTVRRDFIKTNVELCNHMGCRLIAEGVETEKEYHTCLQLGVSLFQGGFFGRPHAHPQVRDLSTLRQNRAGRQQYAGEEVGKLLCLVDPVSPDTPLRAISQRFSETSWLAALPIVRGKRPLGMITRWHVLELFSTQFGRSLYEKKPAIEFLSHDTLIVDENQSITEVALTLSDEDDLYVRQYFIIVREGLYLGLGSTRDLLKHLTQVRLQAACHANPLTQLPGNVPISQRLDRAREHNEAVWIAYFDLDHFKPFNDIFGHQRGDEAILLVAQALKACQTSNDFFVGHVGGDDFLAVFSWATNPEPVCREVQDCFYRGAANLYPQAVTESLGFHAMDRNGMVQHYPLMTLSVGLLRVVNSSQWSSYQVSEMVCLTKKAAKAATDHFAFYEAQYLQPHDSATQSQLSV
jgi:diguanylate cyclase (GGDEF)-like protein